MLIGIDKHGPEFNQLEILIISSYPDLPVAGTTFGIDHDPDREKYKKRQQQDQADK
jgi:hypothetical protein